MPLRPNRPCRDHEREWRNHCVDANLENTWLEAFNNLRVFSLISICEGHVNSRLPVGSGPHINLRLKDQYIPLMVGEFDRVAYRIQEKLMELWADETTRVEAKFEFRMNASRSRQEISRSFAMRIEWRRPRTDVAMDEDTSEWFLDTIERIQIYDAALEGLLTERCVGSQ